MVFFPYLLRIIREYPFLVISTSLLMAVVALSEGVVIALVIPLITIALGQESASGSSEGILGYLTGLVTSLLEAISLTPTMGTILIAIVAIFFLQGFLRLLQTYLQWRTIERYEFSLIHEIFQRYLHASWSFFVDHQIGHLLTILTTETHRMLTAFKFVLQALAQAFLIGFYIIISIAISWKITLLGIGLGIVASIFLKTFVGRMERYGEQVSKNNGLFGALALDLLSVIKMIKASATEKKALAHLDVLTREKSHLNYISQMSGSVVPSFYFPLVMGMLALIAYFAMQWWDISLSLLIIFLYLFYRLIPALSAFHSDYQQSLIFIPAVKEIDAILEESRRSQEQRGTKRFSHLKHAITFDNVEFTYQEGSPVLHRVNLTIPKGKTLAIVGISGAGKTSLVDLLLGLFTPSQGAILVDGTPLSDYDLYSWRSHIGYMSQDIFLLNASVKTNLLWTSPRANEERIMQALRAAHAYEFVAKLPDKLDTMIGDRGVKLSGGQRQRIALARLLLQNPDVIILDEAMSALDAKSESFIQKALQTSLKGKTKIIISHRLASIRDADMIVVLEKGSIKEQGTWDELTNRKGLFAALQKDQAI